MSVQEQQEQPTVEAVESTNPFYEMQLEGGQIDETPVESTEQPTGEESSPELPATEAEPEAPKAEADPSPPAAQPDRIAEDLRRELGDLKRQLEELRRPPERKPEPAPEAPKPSKVDRLKQAGYTDDDPIVAVVRELENDLQQERDASRSLREQVTQTGQSVAQREHAERVQAFDSAVIEFDPELYGTGDAKSVSQEALKERAESFKKAVGLANMYAQLGEEIPHMKQLARQAHVIRHFDRIEAKAREAVRAEYAKRQGTPLPKPSPTDSGKSPAPKYGKQAAIENVKALIAEHPELQEAGVVPGLE